MPPYGRLSIPVDADTRPLEQAVSKAAQAAGQQAAGSISGSLARATRGMAPVLGALGKAASAGLTVAAGAAVAFGVASFRTAARVSTMDKALQAMAKANNTSYKSMQDAISGMRRQGITTEASQRTVASFTRGQLDLRKAQDLARVAQDAATITGRNQNEVVSDLTRGIMTQNVRLLRNAGVSVDVKKAQADYAAQLGITTSQMTSSQKSQAVLNAVLQAGGKIAGSYAAAMREPGRVLQQFPTIIAGIQESVGAGLLKAFGPVIVAAGQFATSLSAALVPGGKLAPIMDAFGQAMIKLVGPLSSIIERWARWIDNLRPEQIARIVGIIKTFGPAALAAAGGLASMAAPSVLGQIPVLGGVVQNLGAPMALVKDGALTLGKAAAGTLIPSLKETVPAVGAASQAFGGMAGPIGLAVAGFALLMAVSPEFRAAVLQIVSALGQALKPVLDIIIDSVKLLIPPVIQIAQAFGGSLAVVLLALVPILNAVATVLTWLRPVLGPITAGVIAWTAAQWLLNAALSANPIGLVIIGIAALATALVMAYQRVAWFRTAVQAMGAALAWLGAQLAPLGNLFAAWGAIIAGSWRALWAVITGVASIAWLTVQTMVRIGWAVITGIFQVQMALLTAMWRVGWAVIQAVLQVVWAAIVLIVQTAIATVTAVIRIGLALITGNWTAAHNAWRAYTQAIWNAILAFLRVIFAAILTAATAMMNAFRGLWSAGWNAVRNTTVSIGTAIEQWISGLWARILATARNAWNAIVNAIGAAWNRVRDAVAGPARWVVNSIINPLVRGINALITKIGIAAIPQIPAFHEGGRVPGNDRGDRHLILAEAGEWVLTRRQAQGIGYGRLARLPRYQAGGYVGPGGEHVPVPSARLPAIPGMREIGGAFARMTHMDDLFRAGRELFDDVLGMLTYAAAVAFEKLSAPLKKLAEPLTKDAQVFPKQWLGKVLVDTIDKAVEFIRGKAMGPCGDIGLGGGNVGGIVGAALKFNGRPYRWGGGANPSTGFDCSSFVSYIAGSMGLPLPGGFRVPSAAHGPVTTDYLRWGGMRSKPLSAAKPGDVAVSPSHIGFIIGPGGSGFAARSTATGIGPQNFARGYTYREWLARAGNAALPDIGGGICGSGEGQSGFGYPGNVESWRGLVTQMANRLGIPWTVNAWLAQIRTESGGNPNAIQQVRDINWPHNRAQGLLQVIPTTFRAYAGPYLAAGPLNAAANIFAAMSYAIARYGKNRLTSVIGRGHGYAAGGIVSEPVVGIGLRSGQRYTFAERGAELVSPLSGPPGDLGGLRGTGLGRAVINVYPSAGMDERQLAAAVSRELAWAAAGGAA